MKEEHLIIGKITGAFGIKGWVKVHSYTDPGSNLFNYSPLYLVHGKSRTVLTVEKFQAHGKGYIAKFKEVLDRTAAELLHHAQFEITRDQLPEPEENEFYWMDLIGLAVYNEEQILLGHVDSLFNTGANDILVVKGKKEHLIPFVAESTVKDVDMEKKTILVDWDEDF